MLGQNQFRWVELACFDFSSSNFNLQGYMLAPVELL